jgi:hypothetical protein
VDATTIPESTPGVAAAPDPARRLYRRRQRRRAIIGWTVGGLVVALFVLGAIFGGEEGHPTTASFEMTAGQYAALHRGEVESVVFERLGGSGLREDEVEGSELLGLFPARPRGSVCSYWTLSDAPGHLVRLCFGDERDVLLQKSVAAEGDDAAPKTLV